MANTSGPKADKIWTNAIRLAVLRETKDPNGKKTNYLNIIATQLVSKAADGDTTAMKEVGDRLDGRPAQAIEGNMNLTITLAPDDAKFG